MYMTWRFHFPLRNYDFKKTLTSFNIGFTNWEICAQDRPLWCSMIHTGARTADTNRFAEAQKKRAARKARLYTTTRTSAGPTYPYPECGRVLQARIGLISHHTFTHCVGPFTPPDLDTTYKGPTVFSVSSEIHWQSGVNEIAKVPKRRWGVLNHNLPL